MSTFIVQHHIHPAIYIVNIRTDLFAHGNAVTGAGGACKDMNRLLSLIIVEQWLHLVHDLPIARECAGRHDHGLAVDLELSACILCQHADHRPGFVC